MTCGPLKDPGVLCGNLHLPEVVGHPKRPHTALTLTSSGGGFLKGMSSARFQVKHLSILTAGCRGPAKPWTSSVTGRKEASGLVAASIVKRNAGAEWGAQKRS